MKIQHHTRRLVSLISEELYTHMCRRAAETSMSLGAYNRRLIEEDIAAQPRPLDIPFEAAALGDDWLLGEAVDEQPEGS